MTATRPAPLAAVTGSLLLGGSSTFLLNLARTFQRRGFQLPIVVLADHFEHREDFAALGMKVDSITARGVIYEDRIAQGYEHLARHQPRAVLACLAADSFETLRLVPPGVPRLGIIQSDDPGPYLLPCHYAPWLDAMVGVSAQIADKLRALPECTTVRVEHIPYGIDFSPPAPRVAHPANAPLRVIYVGRLIEVQKRISRLAQLITRLEEQNANVRFSIVGSGPDEAAFKASVANCRSVRLLGTLPNHQVAALLREQDVFILLSDFEGLPLSLLEAMGEGVVPIVSDLPGGMRELVTDGCGIRVPVGDVDAAAKAIVKLERDRASWAKLSDAASRLAREQYSADAMADRYLSLVDSLAAKAAPEWPAEVAVPTPQLVRHPWLYRGWVRSLRRSLKRLSAA
ncbi:MAG: glycosyltransferase family 4 protein [Verrucomicrobiota bacterium]